MYNFRGIVTLKNGSHKIIRVAYDEVAHIVYEFQKLQKSIWRDEEAYVRIGGDECNLATWAGCKFINERNGKELLAI